jgi:hypothetical protein
MSVIDSIFDIWKDLEASYADKGSNLSRKQFLFKLIAMNEKGNHKLDVLKSKVLDNYVGNEDKCDLLTKIFDALAQSNLSDVGEIEDLDVFVGDMVNSAEVSKGRSVSIDYNDILARTNPYCSPTLGKHLGLIEHVLECGFVTDVTRLVDGKVVTNNVKGFEVEGIVVLKSSLSIKEFVDSYKPDNEFMNKCFDVIRELTNSKKMPSFVVFLSKEHYTHRSEKVNFVLGKKKLELKYEGKESIGGVNVLTCAHTNTFLETPVYCIS